MTSNIGAIPGGPDRRHARLPYLPGLDGLRAIAVIAVLLFHAGLDLRGGFLGVESFFVISGFLINGLLLAEWREYGRVDLARFWLRRARRLLPALFLVLASTLLYAIMFLPSEVAEVRANVAAALLYVMNWQLVWTDRPYFDLSVRPPLLQHLWSLGVEEQFYLLWPLLFIALVRTVRVKGLLLVTLGAAVASTMLMAVLYQPGADPSRIYYGTDTRAAGLLLGAALAVVWRPGHPPAPTKHGVGSLLDTVGVLALGALIVAYLRINDQHPLLYPGGFVLVGLATAVIIMAVTHPQTRLAPGVLGWQPLRWIGLRSYGIYLWHWPIFQVTRPYLDVPLEGWLLLALRLALVAGVAALSYRWVESPIRHGALERAWGTHGGWDRVTSRLPNTHWWGRHTLRVPLMVMLVFAGAIWLASIGTPRAAGGDAAAAPAPSPAAGDAAVPSAVAVRPTMAPVAETSAPPAARPTSSLSTSMAAGRTAITAVAGTTANAEGAEHGAEPAPAPATPTAGVDETQPDLPPLDTTLTAELQRLLDDTVADGFIPGAVLSISIPGSLPWSSASGVADRQRDLLMEPDTPVHIGSITKMFTAVVVLQLAGEGKIDLDAPIGRYLPGIVRFADSTTVRQLLSHTSGIYDYQEDPQFIVEAYEDPEHMYEPAEMVAMADRVGIVFRPGTPGAWRYSSTNYVILGMLVEQVTGRTLAEELRARIFEPLELTHTFFAPYDDLEGTPAQGYIGTADRVILSMTFVYGTANIVSTADDLRRFTDALFGGRLLTVPSLAMMTSLVDTGGAFAMPELEYGLGVMGARMSVGPGPDGRARPDEVTTVLGHIGGIAGFRSAAWWAPGSGITIALSLNQADIDPNILARDVFDAILTWQGR